MNLVQTMSTVGHLASRRQLESLGYSRRAIDQGIRSGLLLPVRPGWVAMPHANQLAVIAVLQGGRLTGATALRSYGVWAGSDLRIHVQVHPGSHRVVQTPITALNRFTPPRFEHSRVVLEWAAAETMRADAALWRVTPTDALIRFARAESDEQVAAAIESLVRNKRMSRRSTAALHHRLPRRFRRMLARLNFLGESGLETVGRLRIEDAGYIVQQQVTIGPDRVDLVIDGWLVIEWDGDEWHDPKKDRLRTNRLIRAGYTVLRFGYADVFYEWERTMHTIRSAERQVAITPLRFELSSTF